MKNKKLLLVCLSLIVMLVFASCTLSHQCNFGEEWKSDEVGHWHECECGEKQKEAHSFGEWTEGETEKVRECSVCGYQETAPLEQHEHDYSEKWSKDGENHWHSCSGCNVPSDKAPHEWDEGVVTTPATEETEGVKLLTCTACGATKEDVVPKLEHTHIFADELTYDETHHWYPSTCGHNDEVKDKAEHTWDEGFVTTPATEEADGINLFTCTACGATKEETIPMLNHTHNFSEEWTSDETHHWHAATCIHTGEMADKAEHDWNDGEQTLAPTCSAVGTLTFTCTTCGATKTEDIPKLSHTEEVLSAVSPSCTATGLTEGKKCSACGEILVAQEEISANGHTLNEELLKDENNHWQVCGICGEKSELIPHAFDSGAIVDGKVICTCLCGYTMENIWDGATVSEGLSGSGTEEDPYLVQSGADLAYIDQNMTAAENFKGVYFKMTRSIDLGNYSMKIGEYPGWGGRKIFSGIFDGNNCSIINLNMTESGKGAGLFSVLSGTVKNLTVYGKVAGDDLMTGGIVGWLYNGTLENCVNYVNVTSTASSETGAMVGTCQGGTIINCVNYGSVEGIDSVGGIAGKASGTIEGTKNYGTVTGCTNLGGIYGSVHSSGTPTVTNCEDLGTISAHNLTHHEAKANSCEEAGNVEYYSCSVCGGNYDTEGNKLGTVETAATGHAWDEGVVAEGIITFTCGTCGNTRTENAVYTITVNHLYLDGSVAVEADAFEYGYNEAYTVYAKTIEGYAASHDYVKGTALDNQTVTIYYSEVDVWDGTSVSTSLSGSGTEEDPYLIQSAADLAYFAQVVNNHNVDGTFTKDHTSREVYTVYTGVYFKLTKSIDLDGKLLKIGYSLAWNKYSRFGGTFDGNNCSIRGISITADETNRNDALFGMTYGGTIKNLSTYGDVYGGGVLNGGIVGYLVSATVENCTSYVNIEGNNETGGIVGNLDNGTLINCTNYGKVSCSGASAGVIVGKNASGTVTNCISFTELNAE